MSDTPKFDAFDSAPESAQRPAISKAVALGYERGVDAAPKILASGKGAIAEQILQIAFERGIKVREDAELVEILSILDVDSPIPLEAFTAVAEILAHVYRANAAYSQRGNHG
jgi:flagellar biosynthesis protein